MGVTVCLLVVSLLSTERTRTGEERKKNREEDYYMKKEGKPIEAHQGIEADCSL